MDVMRRTQVSKADSCFLQALPILAKIAIRKFLSFPDPDFTITLPLFRQEDRSWQTTVASSE